MIKYLIEFTRDYFTLFIAFWQNTKNREYNVTQNNNQFIQQRTVNGLNILQQNIKNNVNEMKNSQNHIVTVQTQEKLQQRSINQTNITSSKNSSMNESSYITNSKICTQSTHSNEQISPNLKQQIFILNSDNILETQNNSTKQQIQYERTAIPYQNIEDQKNKGKQNNDQNETYNQFNKDLIGNTLTSNSNKSEQDSTAQSQPKSESIDKQNPNQIEDFQFKYEQYNNQVQSKRLNLDDPTRINLQIMRKQIGSRDVSPNKNDETEEQYSPQQYQKIQQQTFQNNRKSSPVRNLRIVQKQKTGELKRAIDTISFCNPCLLNNWFNKKANKNGEIKSQFITISQLQDVMPDIDQTLMSLQQYKLKKLKEQNINDQKLQWEDCLLWMRSGFDSCYSRNVFIQNSIQRYISKLEECFKNNVNFRAKLGQYYKQEMIKNNMNSYEISSQIIKMQNNNRYIIKQKKQNKNSLENGYQESIKFKSENNLDDFISPISKKSKSNRFSVQSSNNLDTSINQALKLQNLQQDDEINLTHLIVEEEETGSPSNEIINRQNNKDIQKNVISQLHNQEHQNNFQDQQNSDKEQSNKFQEQYLNQSQNNCQEEKTIYRNQISQNQYKQLNNILNQEKNLVNRQNNQQIYKSTSPQKLANNNLIDYDLKTKIIKLQPNYFIRAFIQPNKISSMQSIQDKDQEPNFKDKNNGKEINEKNKSWIIPDNKHQSVNINMTKNINQDQHEQFISNQNSSNTQLQKIKQSIVQQSESNLLNNNSQLKYNLLSRSLSRTAYSSKNQKKENMLYRMGIQKQKTKKNSDPSINSDMFCQQPSNDLNQQFSYFLQHKNSEDIESCSDQYKSGRVTPISSTSQKDSGTFSTQISNMMRNNQQKEIPTSHHLKKTSSDIKDNVISQDKKNSTSATPFYNQRQNDQKNMSQTKFKPLYSEKFKLIAQQTSQIPTKINDFEMNSDIKREIVFRQKTSHRQSNEKLLTNVEQNDLSRYQIQSTRKTKRSESSATIRHLDNRVSPEKQNQSISQVYSSEGNKQGRSVDLNKQEQNNIKQNSSNILQDNEIFQKEFLKLIQNPKTQGMNNLHLKQKTRNHSLQQSFTNVQMNRSLLQSQQIRRQNNNQMYFQSYFLNNKLQTQPKEQLKSINQENPSINNQSLQNRMFTTFYEKSDRNNKSPQRQPQTDQQNNIQQQRLQSQTSLKKEMSQDISPNKLQIKVRSIIPEDKKHSKYLGQVKNRESNQDISKQNGSTQLSEIRSIVMKGTNQVLGIGNMINKK